MVIYRGRDNGDVICEALRRGKMDAVTCGFLIEGAIPLPFAGIHWISLRFILSVYCFCGTVERPTHQSQC